MKYLFVDFNHVWKFFNCKFNVLEIFKYELKINPNFKHLIKVFNFILNLKKIRLKITKKICILYLTFKMFNKLVSLF